MTLNEVFAACTFCSGIPMLVLLWLWFRMERRR